MEVSDSPRTTVWTTKEGPGVGVGTTGVGLLDGVAGAALDGATGSVATDGRGVAAGEGTADGLGVRLGPGVHAVSASASASGAAPRRATGRRGMARV